MPRFVPTALPDPGPPEHLPVEAVAEVTAIIISEVAHMPSTLGQTIKAFTDSRTVHDARRLADALCYNHRLPVSPERWRIGCHEHRHRRQARRRPAVPRPRSRDSTCHPPNTAASSRHFQKRSASRGTPRGSSASSRAGASPDRDPLPRHLGGLATRHHPHQPGGLL
jgi:hypothetical protein